MEPGNWLLMLKARPEHAAVLTDQIVGEVTIQPFTPPSFEVAVDTPRIIRRGETFAASATARRLNGKPLENAEARFNLRVYPDSRVPEHWPEGFDWSHAQSGREVFKAEQQLCQLDELGACDYSLAQLDAKLPVGTLVFSAGVTAQNGQYQQIDTDGIYLGRDHYVGTRQLAKGKRILEVVAVDADGKSLEQLPVDIAFVELSTHGKVLKRCSLTQLPGQCEGPPTGNYWGLRIQSGEAKLPWHRNTYWQVKQPDEKLLSIAAPDSPVKPNQTMTLNLKSRVKGTARIAVLSSGVKHQQLLQLDAGDNELALQVGSSWGPWFEVSVYLPLKDSLWGDTRWPKSSLHEKVRVAVHREPLEVSLSLPETQVQSGSNIALKLGANFEATGQVWLVNDALWQLTGQDTEALDINRRFYGSDGHPPGYWFYQAFSSGRAGLGRPKLMDDPFEAWMLESKPKHWLKRRGYTSGNIMMEQISVSGSRVAAFAPGAGMSDSFSQQKDGAVFGQSVWLGSVALQAGKTVEQQLQLPQLIGRWRLVVLSGNVESFDLDSTTLTTVRPVEYHLDGAPFIVASDQSTLGLSVINRDQTTRQASHQLGLNGQSWLSDIIDLAPGETKRLEIPLPELPPGEHEIVLTSPQLPNFATRALVTVLPKTASMQRSLLFKQGMQPDVALPAGAIDVLMSRSPASDVMPDWLAQSDYVQRYPHQCWEQTLSRTLSYHYNPQSRQRWPEGEAVLADKIKRVRRYLKPWTRFVSFFPQSDGDEFLTAYTYLARSWLEVKSVTMPLAKDERKGVVTKLLEDDTLDVTVRSMALLALAANGDLTLDEMLAHRQQIGVGSGFAQSLQLMALKQLDAPMMLTSMAEDSLTRSGYQDETLAILNDNAERCFAVLALGATHPRAQQLMAQLQRSQRQMGHFGTTFADGVCSMVFTDRVGEVVVEPQPFEMQGGQLALVGPPTQDSWLTQHWQQPLADLPAVSEGLDLSRKYYRLVATPGTDSAWQLVEAGESLKVGDVIKVELDVNSPTLREHVVITDSVPGAFEVVDPKLENQFDEGKGLRQRMLMVEVQVGRGVVHFYPRRLVKGNEKYTYYAYVRHTGSYLAAGSEVQMMYQPAVHARTAPQRMTVR